MLCSVDLENSAEYLDAHALGRGACGGAVAARGAAVLAVAMEAAQAVAGEEDARVSKSRRHQCW